MIRRPWWTEATGQIWPGCYTPYSFERHPGIFLWSQKVRTSVWRLIRRMVLFDSIVPHHFTGALGVLGSWPH